MKKFSRIIFHVGPDKTGSTSIQKTLNSNKELLLDNGFLYAVGNRHHLLASYFAEKPENFTYNINLGQKDPVKIQERDQSYMRLLVNELENTDAQEVIFSYEGFIHLSKAELEKLRDYFLDYTDNFLVVMYAREPLSYALSAMSQRVKMGRPSWSHSLPVHLYRSYIEKFVSVFTKGSIKINAFDKTQLVHQNVVDDFLVNVGVNESVLKLISYKKGQENKALSLDALLVGDQIIHWLNGYFTSANQFKIFVPYLEKITGQPISMSEQQKRFIMKSADPEMEYLKKEFGIQFQCQNKNAHLEMPSKQHIKSKAKEILSVVMPEYNIPKIHGYRFTNFLITPTQKLKSFIREKFLRVS